MKRWKYRKPLNFSDMKDVKNVLDVNVYYTSVMQRLYGIWADYIKNKDEIMIEEIKTYSDMCGRKGELWKESISKIEFGNDDENIQGVIYAPYTSVIKTVVV